MNFVGICPGVVAALLSGACTLLPSLAERRDAVDRSAPVCSGALQCSAQWEAARHWVVENAGLPIWIADEEHIETYNGYPAQDPRLVVHVYRVAQGKDGYRLRIEDDCAYDFGCIPDRWNAALDFNRFVARAGAG